MRKNELTALVLLVLNINLYLVTSLELWVVTEFRSRDDTIALVADVNNYFLLATEITVPSTTLVLLDLVKSFVISLSKIVLTLPQRVRRSRTHPS